MDVTVIGRGVGTGAATGCGPDERGGQHDADALKQVAKSVDERGSDGHTLSLVAGVVDVAAVAVAMAVAVDVVVAMAVTGPLRTPHGPRSAQGAASRRGVARLAYRVEDAKEGQVDEEGAAGGDEHDAAVHVLWVQDAQHCLVAEDASGDPDEKNAEQRPDQLQAGVAEGHGL